MSKKLLQLVREECCSFAPTGAFGQKEYCDFEHRQTGHRCTIFEGIPCEWFLERVLPFKPELKPEWDLFLQQRNPEHTVRTEEEHGLRRCACGATYKPRSNRQDLCVLCAKKRSRNKARVRKQKQREAA